MNLWGKIRAAFAKLMYGRNGVDNLSVATLWTGLILSLLDNLLRTGLLSLLGMALYIYSIWRMFSRNSYKRAEENRKFVTKKAEITTKIKQFFLRLKNSREYKYFKCPQCKVLIRLKRGSGEKQLHCPKCGCEFHQKA